MYPRKRQPKKLLSLGLLLCLWALVGAGISLAWFTDRDLQVMHVFHFADFDLEVEYRDKNGQYQVLEGAAGVFDQNALYEPGYVQVVCLRVTNKGDAPFLFQTAVRVTDYTASTNVFGEEFLLQEYLRFGVVAAETEAALAALFVDRESAAAWADTRLGQYSSGAARLEAGAAAYIGVVVRMPKDMDNSANYRGQTVPRVELGLTLRAEQLQNKEEALQ